MDSHLAGDRILACHPVVTAAGIGLQDGSYCIRLLITTVCAGFSGSLLKKVSVLWSIPLLPLGLNVKDKSTCSPTCKSFFFKENTRHSQLDTTFRIFRARPPSLRKLTTRVTGRFASILFRSTSNSDTTSLGTLSTSLTGTGSKYSNTLAIKPRLIGDSSSAVSTISSCSSKKPKSCFICPSY